MDQISLQRIQLLHPKLREEAKLILADVDKALTGRAFARFTFTLRTFAEQQALYDQGRSKPGPRVTNAKPGQSLHNYGLAVDFALVIDHKEGSWDTTKDWDDDKIKDWQEVVDIFKKYGWEWGGDWKTFKDMPHFQKTFGHTWITLQTLRAKGQVDKDGYVTI